MNQTIEPVQGGRSLLKAILQAALILAITAGFSQAVLIPLFQDSLLEPLQRWDVEYLNGGVAELLAAELNGTPARQRDDYLDQIADEFGYDIAIRDTSELGLDEDSRARLRNLEVVGDPVSYSAYRQLDDGRVLALLDTKLPAGHLLTEGQRRNMGALRVLEHALRDRPALEWMSIIEARSAEFEFPVALVPIEATGLGADQLDALKSGQIVTIETEDSEAADYPAEMAYRQVGNQALVIGPLSGPMLKRFYPVILAYYLLLAIIILLPLSIWLAPTWRSMNQLSNATAAFGHGDFGVRAAPIRGSKTNHLIEVFNQMASKIQSLVNSNKALINAVSHELRTPISRIEFNIELARQSTDLDERNRQLDRIEGSVDELKTMVSEMLQYARFDREKPNFVMESVDVGEWLQSEHKNWHERDVAVAVELSVPNAPIRAPMERYYMSRAIGNLVRNAMRFAASEIMVDVSLNDDVCEISVSDDGPGVDYQERTRIFEPFARHDQSRSRESGGTGLGLAIVKQILAWHSGEVWVEESIAGGAKFIVQWPVTKGGSTS